MRQAAEPIVDCRGRHVSFRKRRREDVQSGAEIFDVPSRSTIAQFVLDQLADELGNCLGALNDPAADRLSADAPSFLRSVRN